MTPETKKYLIIGGFIVLAVGVGVVVWKKYQLSSSANAAATDQSNQDELALLSAALESNAYAGSGASGASFSPVTSGVPQTLAQEILALEQALGITPTPTGGTSGTGTGGTGSGSGTGGTSGGTSGGSGGTGSGPSGGGGTGGGNAGTPKEIAGTTPTKEPVATEVPTYEHGGLSAFELEYATILQ